MKTRYRLYKWKDGKEVLVSWVQRRCKKCQRFLSNMQNIYCSTCARKAFLEAVRNNESCKEFRELQRKLYRKMDKIEVGQYV